MGEFSIYHWLIAALVVFLVFGARRIPELLKGVGEGIRFFKESLSDRTEQSTTSLQTKDPRQPK